MNETAGKSEAGAADGAASLDSPQIAALIRRCNQCGYGTHRRGSDLDVLSRTNELLRARVKFGAEGPDIRLRAYGLTSWLAAFVMLSLFYVFLADMLASGNDWEWLDVIALAMVSSALVEMIYELICLRTAVTQALLQEEPPA